jgi:hypothetical protein
MQITAQELGGAGSPATTEPALEMHLTPEEADAIFALAEAEIQPLLRKMSRDRFIGWVQVVLCVSLILFSLGGIVWQCITYPHTLIVLYAKATPASITATFDMPTRTLVPVTITRSATAPTTGHGHQDARTATGTLIFYNGSATPQYVPVGSVFTGNDGVKVTTEQSITVPASNLPAIGSIRVVASALLSGSHGNIAAFDVDMTLSPILKVRNEAPFTNGRDAREYQAVAHQDLTTLTSTMNDTLTQAFTTAFPLQQGEQAIPTQCHTTTSSDHQIGQEAQRIIVTASKTCSAVAYTSQQLHRQATAAFTHTKPGARYHINGNVLTTVQSVFPFSVTIKGSWSFTFSTEYEQLLAQLIAGDTPAQARKVLIRTGVISYVSIPTPLPPEAMYIDFIVLS